MSGVFEDTDELNALFVQCGLNPNKYMNLEEMRRSRLRKKILVDIHGGACSKCGYDRNVSALDFHHILGKKKNFNISWSCGYFTSRQFEEILIPEVKENCILLCANCHREIHHPDQGLE